MIFQFRDLDSIISDVVDSEKFYKKISITRILAVILFDKNRNHILAMSDILDSHLGHPFWEEDLRTGKGVTEFVIEYVGASTWYYLYGW